MKTRTILFLAISAIITLSFTFVSINTDKKVKVEQTQKNSAAEPVGGFMAEDKI